MIRVYLIHEFVRNLDGFADYLRVSEETKRHLVWDAENPDILFASEWIYFKKHAYKTFQKLWPKAKLRIMYAGEAIEPDFNLFDYVVGFSNKCQMGDRFIRIISPLDMFSGFIKTRVNDIQTPEQAEACLQQKQGFCNFLYSNPNAHSRRDQLFYELSTYKRVDSLGRHLNNVGKMGTGFVGHAGECTDIKALYKFSIASENASFDGYTSEKVYTSLTAHTVPIYFGNKYIAEDLNPKAIINVNDFKTQQELVEYVKYVDTHDEVWKQMVMEPWILPEQMEAHKQRTEKYLQFIEWALNGDIDSKRRLAEGTHVDNYRMFFLYDHYSMELNWKTLPRYIDKAIKKLKK